MSIRAKHQKKSIRNVYYAKKFYFSFGKLYLIVSSCLLIQ
jgi:hypothetical protein